MLLINVDEIYEYVEYGEIVKLCNSKNHSIAIIIELRMKKDQVIELKPH